MSNKRKQLSNPFSTGGGGVLFEAHVQASFVALMLTGGYAPCLPSWPIKKIKLQGKFEGYDTDDLIVFVEKEDGNQGRKLLGQIKHSISITEGDRLFSEVIQAAWNDFNNPRLFTKGRDVIALITGPLSATDINDVRTILEWARHSDNSSEFFGRINLAYFSSHQKQTKLKTFRAQLKKANRGNEVSDAELYDFLKHFHLLGYDLDVKAGVVLSLLHSLIGQYSPENVQALWAQLINEVQSANKNAGTITTDTLPDDFLTAFKVRSYETIPADLSQSQIPYTKPDWNQHKYASELASANLVGSWNEKFTADVQIASQLAKENYPSWIAKIREVLQQPESALFLKNGVWSVVKREELWRELGPRLFDDHLELFKQCASAVLKEKDPQFDLLREERFAASLRGKVLKHSYQLRKGLAESLALIGNNHDVLNHCSADKRESIAALIVREILHNADWVLWGSLNDLLPLLAEAAPEEFLSAVETALQQTSCPFEELFSQEGHGVTGRNYMTGLLWALETLAWEELYLVRVSVILGELATHDPGGNWINRPSHSLITIYLPWLPQTTATIDKRRVALLSLQKEFPEVAWKIILSLLPNQQQTSTGSRKPIWRKTILPEWKPEISNKEYWEQVQVIVNIAIEMASQDVKKLDEIIDHLDHLPLPSLEKVLDILASDTITARPESERVGLWNDLMKFTTRHKRFAGAKWAMPSDLVSKIEVIAKQLEPKNLTALNQRLFNGRDFDLYEESENWEEQRKKLEAHRQQAIKAIVESYGVDAVIQFADTVESPSNVGYSLGIVAEAETDLIILPKLLESKSNKIVQFTGAYVSSRYWNQGWTWVDKINMTNWSTVQKAQFLVCLPFTVETWRRTERLLGEAENAYWNKVSVNAFQSDSQLDIAIDKLIKHGRPCAAVNCLYKNLHDKQPLDKRLTIQALLLAVSSNEPSYDMDYYFVVEIIKALQNDPDTNPDDLFRVEWAYLGILDEYHEAAPKLLEQRLADDPSFFCEVIRLVFRSKNEMQLATEPTKQQQDIATNAFNLLTKWKTPPGSQKDGTYSSKALTAWLEHVRSACAESGHIDVAMSMVGNVLIHTPPDPDGLWIHHSAASVLNAKDAKKMRDGFQMALRNLRGAYWVDPECKEERELAANYKGKAEAVEAAAYHRLATALRELAASYERDINRRTSGDETD
jgi:hypothetical protein